MSFFNFLSGKRKADASHAATPPEEVRHWQKPTEGEGTRHGVSAPGTQISYDATLIPKLKTDHKQLLELFGSISDAFSKNDLPLLAGFLDDFRQKIQGHLLTENVRFYIYLQHSLAEDSESSSLVRRFRQEMDAIGRTVFAFLDKYHDIGTRPDSAIPFGKDMENIGKVLVDRVKREEEMLFPLYFPVD